MIYKVGDTVLCIDQKDWAKYLTLHKEYEVLEVSETNKKINVREGRDCWWVDVTSFELASPPTGWTTL